MIIFGLYLAKNIPFKHVYFHGMVNDAQNKKMSKSKGNVISPIDMCDKYGTDALRMSLMVGNPAGSNIPLSEDKIKAYKHFANKLWNITRFIAESTAHFSAPNASLIQKDQELVVELEALTDEVTADLENYRMYLAAEKLYHYTWHRLADVILEESKQIFREGDAVTIASRKTTLGMLLNTTVRLLHPFMPFVTEELWSIMNKHALSEKEKFLMIAAWPASHHT
jgi:valyl-tRNA synthetase